MSRRPCQGGTKPQACDHLCNNCIMDTAALAKEAGRLSQRKKRQPTRLDYLLNEYMIALELDNTFAY